MPTPHTQRPLVPSPRYGPTIPPLRPQLPFPQPPPSIDQRQPATTRVLIPHLRGAQGQQHTKYIPFAPHQLSDFTSLQTQCHMCQRESVILPPRLGTR